MLLLFSGLPSCIPNPMSFFSSLGIESRSTNGHLPISDIRLLATAFHFALTMNYHPPLSSLTADILDLIIWRIIFVSLKQPCNSECYVNASLVHPELNRDLVTKSYQIHIRDAAKFIVKNYILITLLKYKDSSKTFPDFFKDWFPYFLCSLY